MDGKHLTRKPAPSHKKALSRAEAMVDAMTAAGESGQVTVTIEVHCGGVRRSGVEKTTVESH